MTIPRSISLSPCRRVEGGLAVPGDKSISHRALLVTAIADGESAIQGLSPAADVTSSLRAIQALGVAVTAQKPRGKPQPQSSQDSIDSRGWETLVNGRGLTELSAPGAPIDVGNSGTTIRLLLGILAGSSVTATLTGDASIRERPMARVVDPLRQMGARITGESGGDRAPLSVEGAPLTGGSFELPVASAQVKSALLLAGLAASGTTTVIEPAPSRDHTERLLAYLGAPIEKESNRYTVKSTNLHGSELVVPGDLSSAAFLLVAAAILPASAVTVEAVGLNPTRSGILDVLRAFGAEVQVTDAVDRCGEPIGTVTVRAADRRPVEVHGSLVVTAIDELPLVAVLGAFAEGETVVADAAELRVKESDRIATITTGLRAMGADIVPTADGFVVRGPARLRGTTVDAGGDHRIAMALAVAALAADEPTTITGWDAVGISYPGFAADLERLVVR